MLALENSIIAIEYACIMLAIGLTCYRYLKIGMARLAIGLAIGGVLVFLSCGLHHFSHAWLSRNWQIWLTLFCMFGSAPLAIFVIIGRELIWEKLDLLIAAQSDFENLKSFVDIAPCGLCELKWDHIRQDFRFTRVNDYGKRIIEEIADSGDVAGKLLCKAVPGHETPIEGEHRLTTRDIYYRVAFRIPPYQSGRRDAVLDFDSPHDDGGKRYYQQTVVQNEPGRISIGFTDITDKMRMIARLEKQTITDQLTGLYTRAYILKSLDGAIARSARGEAACYLRIDLDGFGIINKECGHHCGDEAIIWAAKQISSCTRSGEPVGRMGGDEFALITEGDLQTAKRVAERIREELQKPFYTKGTRQQISACIGVAEIVNE